MIFALNLFVDGHEKMQILSWHFFILLIVPCSDYVKQGFVAQKSEPHLHNERKKANAVFH